jgi:hypothetical protein
LLKFATIGIPLVLALNIPQGSGNFIILRASFSTRCIHKIAKGLKIMGEREQEAVNVEKKTEVMFVIFNSIFPFKKITKR